MAVPEFFDLVQPFTKVVMPKYLAKFGTANVFYGCP